MAFTRMVGLVGFLVLSVVGCSGGDSSSGSSASRANGGGGSNTRAGGTDAPSTDDSGEDGTFTAGNAAWRNAEAYVVPRTTVVRTDVSASGPKLITPVTASSSDSTPFSSPRCAIYPVLANKTIWIVARASDSTELKVSHGALSEPAATTKFMPLDANDSILGRKMLASDDALAVEQSDGRITVYYASDDT